MLHVTGFLPYFWIAAPKDFVNADCVPLQDYLNVSLAALSIGDYLQKSAFDIFLQTTLFSGARPVHSISVSNKRSLWGYKGDSVSPFLKITVSDLKSYPKVRGAFERGDVNFRSLFDGSAMMTFESNIAYTLRFMIDHRVSAGVQERPKLRALSLFQDHGRELD